MTRPTGQATSSQVELLLASAWQQGRKKAHRTGANTNARLVLLPGWLVSTFQVSGTSECMYFEQLSCAHPHVVSVVDGQKYRTNITSILPRQEERERETQRKANACVSRRAQAAAPVRESEGMNPSARPSRRQAGERASEGEHKRERVRGGCLGAEGRRRTRRPAKRSGGAACEL